MAELTQKISILDSQIQTALQEADAAVQKVMKEADDHAAYLIEAQQQLFENHKADEAAALTKKLEDERAHVSAALQKKMKAFDEAIDFDSVIEELLILAKGRVCL